MTLINSIFTPQYQREIENNARYIRLEKVKIERDIKELTTLHDDAKAHEFLDLSNAYQEERAHKHYILSIIRIAERALDQLKSALDETDKLMDLLDRDLTDVESPNSPKSPGRYGIPG